MNCNPFMRAVVESAAFFGLGNDAEVHPDAAVSQLENLALLLQELDDSDRRSFRRYVHDLATSEELSTGRTPRVAFLFKLVDDLGL